MSKKVLISGYIGFNNFGDDAIFGCLVDYLKKKNTDITALSSAPFYTSGVFNIKALRYKNPFDILKGIISTDILISGGGSLLQDKTSKKSLFYYLFIIILAKIFGKKVIIFSQGIGPIFSPFMQKITRLILRKVDFITLRDNRSKNMLDEWGIKSEVLCDPFWSLDIKKGETENTIGVQLRQYKSMRENFIEDLANVLGRHIKDEKIKVFSFQNTYDKEICEKFVNLIKKEYNNIDIELVLNETTEKTISDFSKLKYVIAMRYHACLLALKCNIKTLPIIYDKKVEILAREFDLAAIDCEKREDIEKILEEFIYKEQNVQPKQFNWSIFDKFLE